MFLAEERARAAELQRMKRIAGSLLLLAGVVFAIALRLEASYPWASYLRAAAEGAMVGALADWFAVTALFRRPLGLPIPHTAIIPSRKDSLGRAIGNFVRGNFLTAEVIAGRLRAANVAERLGRWLDQPDVAPGAARLVARGIVAALRIVNDADVQAVIERTAIERLEKTPIAPTIGRAMGVVLVDERRRDLLYALVQGVAGYLQENQEIIRRKISESAPWWLPGVDRTIYRKLLDAVTATLTELSEDPDHPLNAQFDAAVERFVARLSADPELIARGEAYKAELIAHPILREIVASLWRDTKLYLVEQSRRDDSALRAAIERALRGLAQRLREDERLASKVNAWAETAARAAAAEYGDEVSKLIAQTVSRWDAETTARRIELQVGRDLQFIRINGTVVGGLAGLAIYSLAALLR